MLENNILSCVLFLKIQAGLRATAWSDEREFNRWRMVQQRMVSHRICYIALSVPMDVAKGMGLAAVAFRGGRREEGSVNDEMCNDVVTRRGGHRW